MSATALDFFPESYHPPSIDNAEEYYNKVALGRELMSSTKAVIVGLARNVGYILPKTLARISTLGNMFADARVVIYENDSTDDTLDQLQKWQKQNSEVVTILTERRGDPVNPGTRCLDRATRMAYYRNKLREYVIEHYPDYQYAIVVDTDLTFGWSYDGIANTFGWQEQELWHFVGSNGMLYKNGRWLHFDVWAFRWHNDNDRPTHSAKINPRRWFRGEALHPLNSCFGGLGVYVMDALKVAHYDGSDCEHVPFHRRMREAGLDRIFMNPSQIVIY